MSRRQHRYAPCRQHGSLDAPCKESGTQFLNVGAAMPPGVHLNACTDATRDGAQCLGDVSRGTGGAGRSFIQVRPAGSCRQHIDSAPVHARSRAGVTFAGWPPRRDPVGRPIRPSICILPGTHGRDLTTPRKTAMPWAATAERVRPTPGLPVSARSASTLPPQDECCPGWPRGQVGRREQIVEPGELDCPMDVWGQPVNPQVRAAAKPPHFSDLASGVPAAAPGHNRQPTPSPPPLPTPRRQASAQAARIEQASGRSGASPRPTTRSSDAIPARPSGTSAVAAHMGVRLPGHRAGHLAMGSKLTRPCFT